MSIDIEVACPACDKKGKIDVPLNLIVDSDKGTVTVDVPPNVVCTHAFQVFLDKNGNIRGYQKVDFQLGGVRAVSQQMQAAGFTVFEVQNVATPVQDMIQMLSPELFLVLLKGLLFNLPLTLVSADDELIETMKGFYAEKFPAIRSAIFLKNVEFLGTSKGGAVVIDLNFSRVVQDPTQSKFAIGQELLKEISSQPDVVTQRIHFNNFVDKIQRDFKVLQQYLKDEYKIRSKVLIKTVEEQVRGKIDKSREQFLMEMLRWHSPDLLKNID